MTRDFNHAYFLSSAQVLLVCLTGVVLQRIRSRGYRWRKGLSTNHGRPTWSILTYILRPGTLVTLGSYHMYNETYNEDDILRSRIEGRDNIIILALM